MGYFSVFPPSQKRSEAASGRETEETPVREGSRERDSRLVVGLWAADVEWETSCCLPLLLLDDGALLHLEGPLGRGGEWHPVQAMSALRDYTVHIQNICRIEH